jgi:aryl-alcohol dehydrogenase-like predicted oxidoreductase
LSANLDLIEQLKPIAKRNGMTLTQLAIAWVLRRPEVTAAIVGAGRPRQIEETVEAGESVLSAQDIEQIDESLSQHVQATQLTTRLRWIYLIRITI